MQKEKREKLNVYIYFIVFFKRLSFEIMAPVLNKPRFTLKLWEFQRSYECTQVNTTQITSDIWQLWDETQFWQKRLISCPHQLCVSVLGQGGVPEMCVPLFLHWKEAF